VSARIAGLRNVIVKLRSIAARCIDHYAHGQHMRYRPLGKTRVSVSALGYGASSLGGVFHAIEEDQAIRAVHVSLDLGINFIDVSPYYGLLKAENRSRSRAQRCFARPLHSWRRKSVDTGTPQRTSTSPPPASPPVSMRA
jgi:hypothetical protein